MYKALRLNLQSVTFSSSIKSKSRICRLEYDFTNDFNLF